MSGNGRKPATVSRDYQPSPDYCVHALELLLKKPVSKERGPSITAPDNEAQEFKHDCPATQNYT
jgi:hypothetical protein